MRIYGIRTIKSILLKLLATYNTINESRYDIKSSIVICGSPRGGTTWLSEILSTIPNSFVLWEPLHLREVPQVAKMGFGWQQYIPPGAKWKEAENYFSRLLMGQFLTYLITRHSDIRKIHSTKVWIIKFCRANMLLPWLAYRFDINPPILFIRHPCAVVASQLRHEAWSDIRDKFEIPQTRYNDIYYRYSDILRTISTKEEVLAARWCLEYKIPLSYPKPHPWILVTYENLVKNGEQEVRRIFERLNMQLPEVAINNLHTPSRSTQEGSRILTGGDQLSGWRKTLSTAQIKRILNIARKFDMDFYDFKTEPDYSRLYNNSNLE